MSFFAIYILLGAIAGFSAGLLGIGGGMIIVPILYLVFLKQGYADYSMHMAVGTSLATIILTALSSIYAHHQKGAVLWSVVKNLAPGLILGAFFGAFVTGLMSALLLQLAIGLFALWVAMRMFAGAKPHEVAAERLPSTLTQTVAGAVIGGASAIFGIGGGSLTVPFLARYGIAMQKAVATSAACGLPIAIAGAIGFMLFGHTDTASINGSIGFVHIYAFLGISLASIVTARWGAHVAHRVDSKQLKTFFAIMMVCVGIYFVANSTYHFF